MSRLFWKIFFSFWLVMILVIVTNLAVTWVQALHFEQMDQEEHVAELANDALAQYLEHGVGGFKLWRQNLHRKTDLRVLLLDPFNREVSGLPLPKDFAALLEGRFRDYRRNRNGWNFTERLARPVTWQVKNPENNLPYTFVLLNPKELSDHLYARSTLLWRIGISTLIVAIIAMLLSLYMVKPIRRLQVTSRKLASGNLDSRVDMGKRNDELGELARDFDSMAEKIQALLEGQQQMLRDVSHELRTPLARLRIALELARKRSGESSELDRMELEAERINALIDDILQLVRLNNAQQPLHKEPIQLSRLLYQLAEDANLKEPRVSIDCAEDFTLTADRKFLARAIDNVIQNALKYSPGTIEVSARQDSQQCLIRIRDFGPGVDESQIDSLFTPFFRADEARGRDRGGYGLGLAIATQAIQAHGGDIQARNHPEGGLEVSIRLPC